MHICSRGVNAHSSPAAAAIACRLTSSILRRVIAMSPLSSANHRAADKLIPAARLTNQATQTAYPAVSNE